MKSHVAIAKKQCPVCGALHESNEILLHKQLKPAFDSAHPPVTGFELCAEHQQRFDAGYIALIELRGQARQGASLEETWPLRTGNLALLKREVFSQAFNMPTPKGALCFVEEGVITRLQAMQQAAIDPRDNEEA